MKKKIIIFLFFISLITVGMFSVIPTSNANGSSEFGGEVGDWYIGEVTGSGTTAWEVGDQLRVEITEKNFSQLSGLLPSYLGFDLIGEILWTDVSVKLVGESEFTYNHSDFAGIINTTDSNMLSLGGYLFNYTSPYPNIWFPSNFTMMNDSIYKFLSIGVGINNTNITYLDGYNTLVMWEGDANGDGLKIGDAKIDWGYGTEKGAPHHAYSWSWNGTDWETSGVGLLVNVTSWTVIETGSITIPENYTLFVGIIVGFSVICIVMVYFFTKEGLGASLTFKKVY